MMKRVRGGLPHYLSTTSSPSFPAFTTCTAPCVRHYRSVRTHISNISHFPTSTLPPSFFSSSMSSTASRATTGSPTPEEAESYRKSRIYTRTGDTGTTSLYNMERRCKAEDFFQALGTVDEVNSQLGSPATPTTPSLPRITPPASSLSHSVVSLPLCYTVWCASTRWWKVMVWMS